MLCWYRGECRSSAGKMVRSVAGNPNVLARLIAPLLVLVAAMLSPAADGKPNIVFMIADDCTFRDLECYGGQARTPHLNQLAGQGMRFTRCFQAAPMCSPTRHSIYTGQYPVKTGAYPNHTRVDDATQSIVQYMRQLGYRVAHSGKSHVNPSTVFDWESIPGKKNPEFQKVDRFVKQCSDSDTPFCLLLCSNEPHTPWDKGDASKYPPDEITLPANFVDTPRLRQGMSRYLAEITYFDSQVGEAMAILDRHKVAENTMLVVVSEQGSSLPFAKWTCYDSGLQSGCIVRWPGHVRAASDNPAMIEYVDFLPTFIEAAGGEADRQIDGKSLLGVLAGNEHHKDYVFGEMTTRGINDGSDYFGIRSVRSSQYKYIWNFTPEMEFKNACTTSPEFQSWVALARQGDASAQKLVDRYRHRPEIELYDVRNDPLEMNNLAADPEFAEIQATLRGKLDAWMKHCHDQGQATEMQALQHMPGRGQRRSNGKATAKLSD